MNSIKISIITVCYNAEWVLEKTIQSVINQIYQNIEYIIIDGMSKDGTIEIIKKYCATNDIKWLSESDTGIYDAMNKGCDIATGDYIYFLNAGDILYNNNVIDDIVNEINLSKDDLIYGHITYVHTDKTEEVRKYGKWCGKNIYFLTGDCINHQAVFAKRHLLIENKFDTNYRICADREWMMRIKKNNVRFHNVDCIICKYSLDEESASIKEKETYNKEADLCIGAYFSIGYIIYKCFDFCRNNTALSKLLHWVYVCLFIRKDKNK